MSAFEFILILVSVVAGFGVSEILSGWGRLIRERASIMDSAAQILASTWLLLMIIRYTWVLWVLRELEWHFINYTLAFLPMLVLALAAYVINPARVRHFDPTTHYLNQAKPFCYLAAFFFLVWTFGSLSVLILDNEFGNVQIIGPVSALVILGLSRSRKEVVHSVAFGLGILLILSMSSIAVTSL